MKYLLLLLAGLCGTSLAQAAQLTFRVDMGGQTVGTGGVHVAGTFQAAAGFPANWNPATTALADPDNDNIWELTVTVPAGVYQYKYVNGNSWPGAELVPAACGQDDGGGNVNRIATVGGTNLRLPITAFGDCATQLRFAVNMSGQTVGTGGMHVVGNFQSLSGYGANWDATALPLRDPDGDGIYEVQIALPAPGRFLYRFVNGSTAETVPTACGTGDGTGTGALARVVDATAAVNTTAVQCFGSCSNCSGVPSTNYTTYWWNDAVFYEIFVRSFFDSNGNGNGDFAGMMQKLDYLNDGDPATSTDLGITGIWLMPMMQSPSYHGYDVTNYKAVESDYGSMADFEAFLAAAHNRGIKVIIDLVLNHTSSQHTWFNQAANNPASPFRNWYIWSATNPGYLGTWGQTVWHPRNGNYFYGAFWDGMPDLNWREPGVKAALFDASRFWLRKGIDGYRLDAVRYLIENGQTQADTPETLALLEQFHDSLKAINPNAFSVGEAWTQTRDVVPYVQNDRLDICFEFDLGTSIINSLRQGNPTALRTQLNLVNTLYPRLQYGTFLTNHDQNRVIDELGGNLDRMKQAAALYLTMPGVPFLYYGEEVGMSGSGPDEDKRRPMQWTAGTQGGFTTGNPWRALNSNYAQFNVATMAADPNSLLNHYKTLIRLRNTHEVLRKGYYLPATASATPLLAYARVYNQEAVLVVSNLGSAAVNNPALSLQVSTLPAGSYRATDLYSGQAAGTLTINAQGGFTGWTSTLPTLAANQTWVLKLVSTTASSAASAQPALALALYPNPASSEARLVLSQASAAPSQLTAYDLTGRVVHTATLSGSSHTLDTSNWAAGTYFVRVRNGNASVVQRLVVAR